MRVLLFFIPFIFPFQFILSQELRVHLLDSSLNEVVLKNPKKISNSEKRKIYHYVEYYVDKYGEVDEVINYYANGKLPTDDDGNPKTASYYKTISFSNIQNRRGVIRSRVEYFTPFKAPSGKWINETWNINGTGNPNISKISKYWPNGNIMLISEFNEDGTIIDGIQKSYNSKGNVNAEFHRSDGGVIYKLISHSYANNMRYEYEVENDLFKRQINYYNDILVFTADYDSDGQIINQKYYSVNGHEIYDTNLGFNESTYKNFLDSKENVGYLEGIYTIKSTKDERNYKVILYENYEGKYFGAQIDGWMYNVDEWEIGDTRAVFEETAVDGFYSITWYDDYKRQEVSDIVEAKAGGAIMSFGDYNMIRLYPKVGSNSNNNPSNINIQPNQENWQGNGSGIILTKNGHIATNHHVIDGANYIEVEFKYKGEIKSFSAEVLRSDPVNDLAIIKINDSSFSGLSSILYNFKIRGSQIGEYVFALGYPKALSMMGSDIKFTDGRISSLNGVMGDVTNYQTSVPIQPGNSGGPLFDENGNLIGINVAKIVAEDVENVSYSVKTLYLLTLIDALPSAINLPSSRYLQGKSVTEQIRVLEPYVVLIKVN
mgnify:CR=1 FL=1